MKRITPTGFAEEAYEEARRRKSEPPRLGSRVALVDALPAGAVIVVSCGMQEKSFKSLLESLGRGGEFDFIRASHGYNALNLRRETVIGVDIGAEFGVPPGDVSFSAILRTRFEKVFWA